MSNMVVTLVNWLVIVILAGVVFMAFRLIRANKQNKTKMLAWKWMRKENFMPDHSHFYRRTGIAVKTGDSRLVLVINDEPGFFQTDDIVSIRSYLSTVSSGRPLGLAPGVVGQISITNHNIDITLKNSVPSQCTISFEKAALMEAWEKRLQEQIAKNAA